jgi:hypothetical protein
MSKSGIVGLDLCIRNVQKVQKDFETAAMAALIKWGRETIDDSKDNYCPVDTGLMKGTGNIVTEIEGTSHNVILYYNTDYAPIVHENPNAYHPIGESGFLLKPFNLRAQKLENDLKNGLGKVIK